MTALPVCYRNKYITPNLNPYSVCLDCPHKTPCTTAILDEPEFEYKDPENERNEVINWVKALIDSSLSALDEEFIDGQTTKVTLAKIEVLTYLSNKLEELRGEP